MHMFCPCPCPSPSLFLSYCVCLSSGCSKCVWLAGHKLQSKLNVPSDGKVKRCLGKSVVWRGCFLELCNIVVSVNFFLKCKYTICYKLALNAALFDLFKVNLAMPHTSLDNLIELGRSWCLIHLA